MKQYITIEQFEKLPIKSKKKLLTWALGKEYVVRLPNGIDDLLGKHYYVPLLNIGQMIEFLDWSDMQIYMDKPPTEYMKKHHPEKSIQQWIVQDGDYENSSKFYRDDSICDALWQAVKEVLL